MHDQVAAQNYTMRRKATLQFNVRSEYCSATIAPQKKSTVIGL